MQLFFLFISDFWQRLWNLLNSVSFSIAGQTVGFGSLILAFLVIGFVISIFWKGAKA